MPELPDLQVICNNLNKKYSNQKLKSLYFDDKAKTNENLDKYNELLLGKTIVGISRYGKEIKIDFESGHYIMLHLMREGELHDNEYNVKNAVFKMIFHNNDVLIMSDFMKQAKITLDPTLPLVPDPFDDSFTYEYLKERLKNKRKTKVKAFLIDQKNILGIGNAYADEILWESRISPESLCGNLPDNIIYDLFESVKKVLKTAVDTINSISPNIISGEIRDFLVVHNKNLQNSPTGHKIIVQKNWRQNNILY
jgi:formamidopyrimidine-DNA glycosylase